MSVGQSDRGLANRGTIACDLPADGFERARASQRMTSDVFDTRRLASVISASCLLVACSTGEEFANLGIYQREAAAPDAASDPAVQGGDASLDAPTDAGTDASEDAAEAPMPLGPPCASSSCIPSNVIPGESPPVHCHSLVSPGGPPLPNGSDPNHYAGFQIEAPVHGVEYVRSIHPIIDDPSALHHSNLYVESGGAARRLIYSWAPGLPSLNLDPSIGVAVAADSVYTLELHYAGGTRILDGSGFRVCYTPTPPEYVVSMASLRAEGPAGTTLTGSWSAANAQAVRLLLAQPELGMGGRHVKVVAARAAGARETILDQEFEYHYNGYTPLNVLLAAGDTLELTCDHLPLAASITMPAPDQSCSVQLLYWSAAAN